MTPADLPPHDACFDIGNGNYYYWRRDSVLLALRQALERAKIIIANKPETYNDPCDVLTTIAEEYK